MAGVVALLAASAGWVPVTADDRDTHGRDAEPDYARVFAQDRVGRLDIRIAAADWQAALDDMTSMAGARGAGGGGGPFAGNPGALFPPEAIAACAGRIEGNACSTGTPATTGRCVQTPNGGPLACTPVLGGGAGGAPPRQGGGAAAGRDDADIYPRSPIYVPAELTFEGETFRKVGFRFKGNSSLSSTWRNGTDKFPFRLNMDALEDAYPDIRDQTFFGFPNLSFSNGALDSSYLKAKVVTDMVAEAGLPAARSAFVRVFLDRGQGLSYLGLYTMFEVPDEPMLQRLFGSDDGNVYKPNGTGGRWTTFNRNNFPKRTNEADEDWTDIEDAIAALHASRVDAAAWRQRLEARFDMHGFLRWLALNTIVGNFDAYGGLSAHNYYLYGSPRHRDRLFWIAWDHDLALSGGGIGGGGGGAAATGTLDLFHAGIQANWPLIRFAMDDSVYRAIYRGQVEALVNTVFDPARVSVTLRSEQARIAPYVIGPDGELAGRGFAGTPAQFDAAVHGPNGMLTYVANRAAAVRAALAAAR